MNTVRTIGSLLLAHAAASYVALGVVLLYTSGANDSGAGLVCAGSLAPLLVPCFAFSIAAGVLEYGARTLSIQDFVLVGIYLAAFVTTLKLRSIQWSDGDKVTSTGMGIR